MNQLERTILRQLFSDKQYAEKVVPYLRENYFTSEEASLVYKMFVAFFEKFKAQPQFAVIHIALDSAPKLTEKEAKNAQDLLKAVEADTPLDQSQAAWILEETERWCQDRAMYCALQEAIKVMDDPKKSRGSIPELMKQALAVSFDTHLGHDYFKDSAERWKFYHRPETKLAFDLDTFNKLTNGGISPKTLNVILAGTNVGKSLALCHFAAAYLRSNKHVLYITCEMASEWIAERIDANMMDIPIDDVLMLPESDFNRKIAHLRQSSTGQIKIKEYPTATASIDNFRALLQDYRLKENFVPEVIMVDYLTICASARIKLNHSSVNSYTYNKYIAEELRGFSQEMNLPLWSAAQFNREGFKSTDPGLEHIGESFGIAMTADFCAALVTSDDLEKLGQIALVELKNRYNKKRTYQQHLLGIDTPRMKLYELSAAQVAQSLSLPTGPTAGQSVKPSLSSFSSRSRPKSMPLATLKAENENAQADDNL